MNDTNFPIIFDDKLPFSRGVLEMTLPTDEEDLLQIRINNYCQIPFEQDPINLLPYIDKFVEMLKDEEALKGFPKEKKKAIINATIKLLDLFYKKNMEAFYRLGNLFFRRETLKLLDYDSNKFQEGIDQGTLGVLRSEFSKLAALYAAINENPNKSTSSDNCHRTRNKNEPLQ